MIIRTMAIISEPTSPMNLDDSRSSSADVFVLLNDDNDVLSIFNSSCIWSTLVTADVLFAHMQQLTEIPVGNELPKYRCVEVS